MAGWYASYEGMEGVTLQAETADGAVLGTAEFTESDDICGLSAGQGLKHPAVKMSLLPEAVGEG